jgi:small subunit ribosomal protein S10
MVQLSIKSNYETVLAIYLRSLIQLLRLLNLEYKVVGLPTKKKVYSLLKSPHVNKKSKDQFGVRIYKKLVLVEGSIVNLREIIRKKPPVIQIKISYSGK